MYILIENEENLEYLTSENNWSKNPQKGKQFLTGRLAFHAARLEAIDRFNIVAYIPETRQFVNLNHGRGIGKPYQSTPNP
jgi:hypothetical protein